MDLIIVESPTKAQTLSRFLKGKFQVESTMGHIRDLPKDHLGIDIKKDFAPDYVLIPQKAQNIKKIKTEAKKAKNIYLATDPDREGEAIAFHVAHILKNSKSLKRISFHEITQNAVQSALQHPCDIDLNLVHAQQARRILDRLVGYKLSPLLWRKIRSGLSAGRVQSVTVRLVVEREKEIENFKPQEYWDILVHLLPPQKKPQFTAKLLEKNGKTLSINNKSQADPVVHDLKKAAYKIASVDKKQLVRPPSPPFTTSTMQQKAANLFHWSARRTMQVAQSLYEKGLITYHRTDSTQIATPAVKLARQIITKEFGKNYLPPKPRIFKKKSKLAQEAHEAIRPTNPTEKEIVPQGRFPQDAKKLYTLIRNRLLASQMADAVYDLTRLTIIAKKQKTEYTLRSDGKVIKFLGWLAAYSASSSDLILPALKTNDPLDLLKVDPQQKFTLPPPRYTEARLIKTLEKLGIGRPSTYASIISTIQTRQYTEKKEGKFFATPLGITTNDFLVKNFDQVMDYKFTARMEDKLDDIAKGETSWTPVVKEFYTPLEQKITKAQKQAKKVKVPTQPTGKSCPICKKGKEVIRIGRFGKFLSCSLFPDCKYTAPYIESLNIPCPGCTQEGLPAAKRGQVVIKKTRKGKSFYGCSRYPKCNWASWRKPKNPDAPVAKTLTKG